MVQVFSSISTAAVLFVTTAPNVDAKPGYGSVTRVDPTQYLRECVPAFKAGSFSKYINSYSNYWLIGEPSGLCMAAMSCPFIQCDGGNSSDVLDTLREVDLSTVKFNDISDKLPPLNLPAYISFPKGVRDIISGVRYAKMKGRSISVKTSGHSYSGSSTMEGSLQLNLRDFSKQSHNTHQSVSLCDSSSATPGCKLAAARNKTATIRVSGNELWDDVYRAVDDWNRRVSGNGSGLNLYEIVGGAAGTVSAAGGWLMGGGLGKGSDRLYGFGVDQLVEMEMVLADGSHVKFGPTEWVDQGPKMLHPQTTKVEGLCNHRPKNDPSQWRWGHCRTKKAGFFKNLWKAVRGGGGGTFGIITAVEYQLHPQRLARAPVG